MEASRRQSHTQIRRINLFRQLPTPIYKDDELREVDMWRAVLDQALTDAMLKPPLTAQEDTARDKARRWIEQSNLFEVVCTYACLDPVKTRAAMLDFIYERRPLPTIDTPTQEAED